MIHIITSARNSPEEQALLQVKNLSEQQRLVYMLRNEKTKARKLSVPSYGRTVWSTVAQWTQPLIDAYKAMIEAIDSENQGQIARAYNNIYSPIMVNTEKKPTEKQTANLAASAILSIWMISQYANKNVQLKEFSEAEDWFLRKTLPSQLLRITQFFENHSFESTYKVLASLKYDDNFVDLFPYIVEIFETLAMFHPQNDVPIKRSLGLYYTPSDICDYIIQEVLMPWETKKDLSYSVSGPSCIDPACGSGVFLRAILDWHSNQKSVKEDKQPSRLEAIQTIYGMDISHQAIQSCAFTLLLDCIDEVLSKGLSPWSVWQAIRGNLAVKDSTSITRSTLEQKGELYGNKRNETRKKLLNSNKLERLDIVHSNVQGINSYYRAENIGDVFPEMYEGFSAIVGNPPYSKIMRAKQQRTLTNTQLQMRVGTQSLGITYLPFVRMMWTFANRRYARAGMVLPLSIAYHSGKNFRALRKAIMARGKWRFGFFDRTPDSLFGDDIKTRNCIALAEFSDRAKSVATTSLKRWNSQNRKNLFDKITFVELNDLSIERIIPKIGSEQELLVYKLLISQKEKIGFLVKPVHNHSFNLHDSRIFFRSTAYNWLPIFRNLPKTSSSVKSKLSKFSCLEFSTSLDADFAFAVASSRVAYWLWRVEGDGFHLNKSFIKRLPFHPSAFSETSLQKLCYLSKVLWGKLQLHPIQKFNAGILAISYCPYDCTEIISEIDKLLIETYNIPNDFFITLQQFLIDTIKAGRGNSLQLNPIKEKIKSEGK